MKRVGIISASQTKFGELWEASLRDLIAEAGRVAMASASLGPKDIEALYIGNMMGGRMSGQEHLAALAANQLNLHPIPSVRCEAACASGALAFRQAYLSVASGRHKVAMALGAEKMTDLKNEDVMTSLMAAGDQEWEAATGLTFSGLYALIARAHMHAFGTTQEQLALVSVNNHKNAVSNPNAQFRSEITVEDVLRSPMVAEPLHLLDCSPITDGAACVIIAEESIAKKFPNPIWVVASEQASDTIALHDRASFVEMLATKHAAAKAYSETGLKPKDIDVLEVHDCFSINEIIGLEDLGFCDKGKGGKFIEAGEIKHNGAIPTNTTGGLKAGGHPVGATGIRQLVDIAKQLRGESCNQLKNPKLGLALNVGGSGATASVNILGVE